MLCFPVDLQQFFIRMNSSRYNLYFHFCRIHYGLSDVPVCRTRVLSLKTSWMRNFDNGFLKSLIRLAVAVTFSESKQNRSLAGPQEMRNTWQSRNDASKCLK